MPNDLDIHTRQGQIPTDDDLFWPEAMRHVQVDVMKSAHWAAGMLLLFNVAGWTVLTAALLMGELGENLVLWLMPLILWTVSGVWALRVFTVRRYRYFANSPDSAQQAIQRIARKKTQHLTWAIVLWAMGVALLVISLFLEFA